MPKLDKNAILKDLNENYSLEDKIELYKALIAYELGFEVIDEETNIKLNKVIEWYYDTDYLTNFINENIYDYAFDIFNKDDEESE